jgi:membrane protein
VIRKIIDSMRNFVLTPTAELNRWQKALQFFVQLCMHGASQLNRDRAPQMAAALAYRTIFSIIPLLVVSIVILRWVSGPEGFREPLRNILAYFGLENLTVPTAEGTTPAAEGITEESVLDALLRMVESAEAVHFGTIGLVGLAILVYAAMSLLLQVEGSFNTIYNATTGRSWAHRITQYWTLITLGPLLLMASFNVQARVQGFVADLQWGGWLVTIAGFALTVAISWLLLLFAYRVVPSTKVDIRSALTGSFVAALLWEAGKYGFTLYASNLTGYGKIYGSLALLPIFMLWVYITWLIVLFGLELSYTLQTLGGHRERLLNSQQRQTTRKDEARFLEPATMISLLEQIGRRFQEGKSISAPAVAENSGLNEQAADSLLRKLVDVGLLHPVEKVSAQEDTAYTLARPADRIELTDALEKAFELTDAADHAASNERATLRALRRAQLDALAGQSLQDLLRSSSRPDEEDDSSA